MSEEAKLHIGFADPFDFHRIMMHRKHGYCGPYRLGISVGFYGEELPCPYSNPRSVKTYNDGIEAGKRIAAECRNARPLPKAPDHGDTNG